MLTSSRRLQGQVHQLENDEGRPLDLVLKSLPRGPVPWGLLGSMEREWAVGYRLALQCGTPARAPFLPPLLHRLEDY